MVRIPDGFVSPAVALAGAAVAVVGLGMCVGRARLEVTERMLPLAGLAAVISVIAAVLFAAESAPGGAAGLPVRTIAMVALGVYTLIALREGLVTTLVVRGVRAVCADSVQTARG